MRVSADKLLLLRLVLVVMVTPFYWKGVDSSDELRYIRRVSRNNDGEIGSSSRRRLLFDTVIQDYTGKIDVASLGGRDPPLMTMESGTDLGLCQGDCSDDSDCTSDLVCHRRSGTDPVPGCTGEGRSGDSYCINPMNLPPGPNMNTFRLKMYGWENYYSSSSGHRGYWCAECDGSCDNGSGLEVNRCDDSSDEWRFLNNFNNKATQIQLVGSDLCWELVSGDVELRPCDSTVECQTFTPGQSHFGAYRFELGTCETDQCITQDHYPRSGEELFAESCDRARGDKSSYWEKF